MIALHTLSWGYIKRNLYLFNKVVSLQCVKFHPNEAYIATGGADRTVRLWSVCDARLVRVLCGHRGVVRALAFAPSGDYLASAG